MNADDTDGEFNLGGQRALVNTRTLTAAILVITTQRLSASICVIGGRKYLRNPRLRSTSIAADPTQTACGIPRIHDPNNLLPRGHMARPASQ